MPKSVRRSSANLTPLETRCPPSSHIRHGTREENPCLFPGMVFLLPVSPLRVQRTGTRLSPSCRSSPSQRGRTADYCNFSGSTSTDPSSPTRGPVPGGLPASFRPRRSRRSVPPVPLRRPRCRRPFAIPRPPTARECPGSAGNAEPGKWKPKLIRGRGSGRRSGRDSGYLGARSWESLTPAV